MNILKTAMSALLLAPIAVAAPVLGQEAIKIGMITSLSFPGGYLGQDIRDGFRLAVELGGGKLGGVPVTVMVEDDGAKPGQGKQIADRLLKSENIKLFTGIVFSNVAGATVPDILDAGAIYVSPNAGPSTFAGKGCNANYFVVSWQNDSLHEAAGELANQLRYKSVYLVAANYQAGKDALEGFQRYYKGKVAGESYTRLDQTDFAAEFLDEATEGLAPIVRGEIWRCIEALKEYGQSILLIDKNVNVLKRLADHHFILEAALYGAEIPRRCSEKPQPFSAIWEYDHR
jgi:branched-chain amino acid transport system substrate-binding protein